MIKKPEVMCDEIKAWIKARMEDAKAETPVVGLSGGADSALVAILCKEAFPNTICVRMPCHSSASSLARAAELAEKFQIRMITVDLYSAFQSIADQVTWGLNPGSSPNDASNAANGALRSCLRAPTLDYVAKLTNGLIIGTGNRDEDEVTRYFQKRGDGCVDISPIAKLHKSEVYQLLKWLDCPQSIIDAKPSADLWGPDSGQEDEKELGLTYEEIEWGIRESDKVHGSLFNEHCGVPLDTFLSYTPRQIEILKKLAHLEKISRHKSVMPPVFEARWLSDEVIS